MRYRHWRSACRCDAVGLGHVARGDFRILGDQKRATHGEASIFLGLGNTGFLQQFQRTATCTDKDETGIGNAFATIVEIAKNHAP